MGNTLINSSFAENNIIAALESAKSTFKDNEAIFNQSALTISTKRKHNHSTNLVSRAPEYSCCGAIEWMTHPGFECDGDVGTAGCGAGPDDFSRCSERRDEYIALLRMANGKLYEKLGVELVHYNKIRI